MMVTFTDSQIFLTIGGNKDQKCRKPKSLNSSETKRFRLQLYSRQGRLCFWCGVYMRLPKKGRRGDNLCTLDHLVERNQPGRNDYACVAACYRCNQERSRAFCQSEAGKLSALKGFNAGNMEWL